MGGAAGHIQHLYENRELRFSELKTILKAAAKGRLNHVTEKLDGQALSFSWDDDRGLIVARAIGDIDRGGLTAVDLTKKFHDRPWIAITFVSAFKVLESAVTALPSYARDQIFGDAERWYSVEVIYTRNPNVINYDQNSIVFHRNPIFQVSDEGVEEINDSSGIEDLARNIDRMQTAVAERGWRLQEPALLRLQGLSDGSVLQDVLNKIERLQHAAQVGDNDTIGDYLRNLMSERVADLDLRPKVADAVTARAIEAPGCPSLTQIKQMVSPARVPTVTAFIKGSPKVLKALIKPLEMAIHHFAVELLKSVQSTLVSDRTEAVIDLRRRLKKAIVDIESSHDEKAIEILQQNMQKLGSINNVNTSIEGIVFIYKGHAYKFTGQFAPLNQILGLFKYGRDGTKIEEQKDLDRALSTLLRSVQL